MECDEGKSSHYVDCSTASLIDAPSNVAWETVIFNIVGTQNKAAWLFCGQEEAIFSRCASGQNRDCDIVDGNANHGIKCGKLSSAYEFVTPTDEKWVCGSFGKDAKCPANHVAVASCGAGQHNDCAWSGCKGKSTYTGLKCKEYRVKPTKAPTKSPSNPPTASPTPDSCFESTHDLLEATKRDYDDKNVRNTKFNLDNKESEILDFTTNGEENAVFKNSCVDAGGRYVELNYEAICKQEGVEPVNLFVSGHPRCYAKVCKADDEQTLFEKYTLKLTEERNSGDWTCEGKLTQEGQTGTGEQKQEVQTGCEFETDLVNDSEALVRASYNFKPDVEVIKFMWIFDREQKLVTFPEAEAFRDACNNAGFKPVKVSQTNIACGDAEFDVRDFSTCLGQSCRDDDQGYTDATVAAQFQEKMADELPKPGDVCTITSGALSVSRGFIAAGTMLFALYWHLIF